MKIDSTVTIHPTVKASTLYAIERMAEARGISLGKVIELKLESDKEFGEYKQEYHCKRYEDDKTPPLFQ